MKKKIEDGEIIVFKNVSDSQTVYITNTVSLLLYGAQCSNNVISADRQNNNVQYMGVIF